MAGVTTTTNITELLPTEYLTGIRTTYEYGAIMKNLMDVITLPHKKGSTVELPLWGQLTAYQFSRGSEINQYQQLDTSSVTISPISVAVHTLIDEFAELTAIDDVNRRNGELQGQAFVRFEDIDLLTLLDGFNTSLGGAGSLKIGHLFAGVTTIGGGAGGTVQAFDPPYNVVVHHNSYHAIAEDVAGLSSGVLTGTASSLVGDWRGQVVQKYEVGNIAGMKIYRAGNLTPSGGVAKGGIFAKPGLVYVNFRPIKTEPEWSAKQQGWEVYTTCIYGRGERFDSAGVELNVTASTPTS